jgi:hypothetical protein
MRFNGNNGEDSYLNILVSFEYLIQLSIQLSKIAETFLQIPLFIIVHNAERVTLRKSGICAVSL